MNDNFSIDYITNTKSLIYDQLVDISDMLLKIYNSTNELFSSIKQIDLEDRVLVNKCGQYLLQLKIDRNSLENYMDEFLVVMDSYIHNERDTDGLCTHLLTDVTDELELMEQQLDQLS